MPKVGQDPNTGSWFWEGDPDNTPVPEEPTLEQIAQEGAFIFESPSLSEELRQLKEEIKRLREELERGR